MKLEKRIIGHAWSTRTKEMICWLVFIAASVMFSVFMFKLFTHRLNASYLLTAGMSVSCAISYFAFKYWVGNNDRTKSGIAEYVMYSGLLMTIILAVKAFAD